MSLDLFFGNPPPPGDPSVLTVNVVDEIAVSQIVSVGGQAVDAITIAEHRNVALTPTAKQSSESLAIAERVYASLLSDGMALPMVQPHGGNVLTASSSAAARYINILAPGSWNSTRFLGEATAAANVTLRNIRVKAITFSGGTGSFEYEVMVNGSPTGVLVTISDTSLDQTVTTLINLDQGDSFTLRRTRTVLLTGTPSVRESISCETVGFAAIYGGAIDSRGMGSSGGGLFRLSAASSDGTPSNIVAAACTLNEWFVTLGGGIAEVDGTSAVSVALPQGAIVSVCSTQVGTTFTYYITVNGIPQDGSSGPDARIVVVDTNNDSAFARYGFRTTPQVPGESNICNSIADDLNFLNPNYSAPWGASNTGWSLTESSEQVLAPATSCTLRKLYAQLVSAPGSGNNFTFSLRRNTGSPGSTPTVVISDSETADSDLVNEMALVNGDIWNIRATPNSSPSSSNAFWSVAVYIPPINPEAACFDTVGVAEGLTAVLTPTLKSVFDAIGVTDSAERLSGDTLAAQNQDFVAVADVASVVLSTVRLKVTPFETVSVADARTAALVVSRLQVAAHEDIDVIEGWLRIARPPLTPSRAEFLAVREFIKAQLYTGGGLGVRVHDTIAVVHNNFYIGRAVVSGVPDLDTVTLGPNPGLPPSQTAFGGDYWIDGV